MQHQVKLNDGRIIAVDVIEEFKHCKQDPIYFIDNYCYIVDPVKGELPFKLFDYQRRALKDFMKYQFNIVRKPRQMGLSWLTACYGLWLINFNNDKTVLIISIRDTEAMEFKDKARYSYDRLPEFLRVDTQDRSKHGLNLVNGSSFFSVPQTRTAGRSKSLSLLILDEVAFQEYADDIWAAAWPTLSTGGNAILISTTNGIGNLYHKVYEEAQEELNDFHFIDINWREFPGRDEEWLLKQKRQLGERKFRSEVLCEFLGSGDTVISGKTLAHLKAKVQDPIIKYKFPDNSDSAGSTPDDEYSLIPGLWIWDPSQPSERYIMSADVGTGNEQDASAFHVVRLSDNKQVCEYKNKSVSSLQYANVIKRVARYYNNAYVIIESNSYGQAVFERVFKDEQDAYTHVYATQKGKTGWITTGKTRPQIIDSLINNIEQDKYKLVSPRLLSELETFVWHGNKPEALKGYNDDLVISLAILMFIRPMLSSFAPIGLTSNRDTVAFRYDDDAMKQFYNEEQNPDIYQHYDDEDIDSEYTPEGYMSEKAIIQWLSK